MGREIGGGEKEKSDENTMKRTTTPKIATESNSESTDVVLQQSNGQIYEEGAEVFNVALQHNAAHSNTLQQTAPHCPEEGAGVFNVGWGSHTPSSPSSSKASTASHSSTSSLTTPEATATVTHTELRQIDETHTRSLTHTHTHTHIHANVLQRNAIKEKPAGKGSNLQQRDEGVRLGDDRGGGTEDRFLARLEKRQLDKAQEIVEEHGEWESYATARTKVRVCGSVMRVCVRVCLCVCICTKVRVCVSFSLYLCTCVCTCGCVSECV